MAGPDKAKENHANTQTRKRAGPKRRKRRHLSAFAWFLIIFVFLSASGVCACVYFLKIDRITVSGKTVYTREQIVSAAGIKVGDRALLINRSRGEKSICSKLPYVLSAKICYNPLTGVSVAVKPDSAALCIKYSGGLACLDTSGKVLETSTDQAKFSSLPVVSGLTMKSIVLGAKLSGKSADQAALAEKIINEFKKNKVTGITGIDLSNDYEIKANYKSRIDILIGTSADLSYKIKFTAALLNNKNDIKDTDKGLLDASQSAQNNKVNFIPS